MAAGGGGGGGGGGGTSSIALLQERFRRLERMKEKREEMELLKLFPGPGQSQSQTNRYEPLVRSTVHPRPCFQDSLSLGLDMYTEAKKRFGYCLLLVVVFGVS